MMNAGQELPPEAMAALARGSKIDAIREVRFARSVGLKEAKEMVEEYLEGHPAAQGKMNEANAGSVKVAAGLSVLVAVAGALLWFLFGDSR